MHWNAHVKHASSAAHDSHRRMSFANMRTSAVIPAKAEIQFDLNACETTSARAVVHSQEDHDECPAFAGTSSRTARTAGVQARAERSSDRAFQLRRDLACRLERRR